MAVVDEVHDQIAHRQQLRTAVHQRDIVHRKRGLQRRILIKGVEHDARHGVVFEDDDDPQAVTVGLVVDVGNAVDLLLVDHVGDLLNHLGLVDHVGDFGDDDALTAAGGMLDVGLGTHHDAAAARKHGLPDTLVAVDNTWGNRGP